MDTVPTPQQLQDNSGAFGCSRGRKFLSAGVDQIFSGRQLMSRLNGNEEVDPVANPRNSRMIWLSLVAMILFASLALPALAASGQTIAHNTPRYVATAKTLGREDPSKTIEVSIWLNPHNRSELDALAAR